MVDVRPNYFEPNYDKEKIASYQLEDPLTFLDGRKVTTPEEWKQRRKEILGIFASEMYGAEPPAPEHLLIEKCEEKVGALGGYAVRSLYRMRFSPDGKGGEIQWLLLRPRYASRPVPVIIFLNYRGGQELIPDEDIPVPEMWYFEPDQKDEGLKNKYYELSLHAISAMWVKIPITSSWEGVSPAQGVPQKLVDILKNYDGIGW